MANWHNWFLCVSVVSLGFVAGCDEPTADGVDAEIDDAAANGPEERDISEIIENGEVRFGGDVVAEVVLDDGTELTFVAIENGENHGVGMLRRIPDGGSVLPTQPNERGASVLDIFWAVTEPGTPVPEAFALAVPGGVPKGEQGWLLERMADMPVYQTRGTGTCLSNTSFYNRVMAPGYDDFLWFLYDEEPSTSSYFYDYVYGWGSGWPAGQTPEYYAYTTGGADGRTYYNVERYYSSVQVCALGTHPNIYDNNPPHALRYFHPGPEIRFSYRTPTGSWTTAMVTDVDPADVPDQWEWHFYTQVDWDWRTTIELAEQNDMFDIGHAAEDI